MNMKAIIRKNFLGRVCCKRAASGNRTITIKGEFVIRHGPACLSWIRLPIASVQIYSKTSMDLYTGYGRLCDRMFVRNGKTKIVYNQKKTTYKLKFQVVPEFGEPGAFLIKNRWCQEFFLESATLRIPVKKQDFHFDCRSWVYPIKKTKTPRVFFSNACYLPCQTPDSLKKLREYELKCLRGELAEQPQPRERKKWDRTYDYAEYNDLGDPDRGPEYRRPVLGGKKLPYPRRLKTNRPPCKQDSFTESRPATNDIGTYIPPDERLSPEKVAELKENLIKAIVYFLLPVKESHLRPSFSWKEMLKLKWFKEMIKTIGKERFLCWKRNSGFNQDLVLNDMFEVFSDKSRQPVKGWIKDKLKRWVPNDELYREIVHTQNGRGKLKKLDMDLPLPSIIAVKKWAWRSDEEFGRQMVAGTNPVRIRCLQNLQDLPPDSKILKKKHKLKIAERISHIYGDDEQRILEELTKSLEVKKQQKGTLDEEFDDDNKKILEVLTKYWEKKKKGLHGADGDDNRIFEELRKYWDIKSRGITIEEGNKNLKIKESQEITIEEELPPNHKILTCLNYDDVDERILEMVAKYLEVKEGKKTLEQIVESGHIFILDHHDHLLKYLSKVNSNAVGGARTYASRTLLFRDFKSFKFFPVAIELSLSSQNHKLIVAPPQEEYMEQERNDYFHEWDLAKTHVAANDSAHHLLVSHWLHTHAVVEPFIIATRRQLSKMHPIYCLLDPHFKDTIHMNALCRAFLINSGGILEKTLFTGEISMELSSKYYEEWRFNRQALPCDLAKRGIVENVPESSKQHQRKGPHGDLDESDMIINVPISDEQPQWETLHGDLVKSDIVKNVPISNEQPQREAHHGDPFKSDTVENVPISIEQPQCDPVKRDPKPSEVDPGPEVDYNYYPYASDGLKIWKAIEKWVTGFCEIFYKSDDCVQKDEEIQQWWKEIREKGHADVHKGWYELTNRENLIRALTTIIWIASALHAAVNFGGYAYALTRPMMCHEYIPEGTEDFDKSFFLQMLPRREEMEVGMALMSFLSHHTSDEVYLGQQRPIFWSDNEDVNDKYRKFNEELVEIQNEILKKNKSYKLAGHRSGAAKIPYKLLYPDISSSDSKGGIKEKGIPKGGITVKGIPNSISI